jgi:hypothetical protein
MTARKHARRHHHAPSRENRTKEAAMTRHSYEPTREAAMAAFAKSWRWE